MTLREKRCAFTLALSKLVIWVNAQPGYEMAYGEGYVAQTDAADGDYDGPHKRDGAHYTGLAHDMNLYVNGRWINDSNDPAWLVIGHQWKIMHPLARWGGNFTKRDANHFSFEHEGRA